MMGRLLELRVHGVSNTPPADLLGLPPEPGRDQPPQPRLVAGDRTTGFYRAPGGPAVAGTAEAPVVIEEAYSWGQLTSGRRGAGARATKDLQRALWTVLLPFSLGNVALHARPEIPADPAAETWLSRPGLAGWLVRVFCLSLTATFALAAAGVGVDLLAWQCVGSCLELAPGPWDFLASGWWSRSTRPLAVGLLLPAGVVLLVWLVARRSFRYEAALPDRSTAPAAPANPLQQPDYWRGAAQVRRLGGLHLAVGLAVAAAAPLVALLDVEPAGGARRTLIWSLLAVLGAAGLLAVAALAHPDLASRRPDRPRLLPGRVLRQPVLPLALLGLAGTIALLLAGTTADLAGLRPPDGCIQSSTAPGCDADRSLPGYDWIVTWLAAGQLLLLVALAGISRTGRSALLFPAVAAVALVGGYGPGGRWAGDYLPALIAIGLAGAVMVLPRTGSLLAEPLPDPYARIAWGGRGPAVLAGVGWALGMTYAAGILYGATDLLNGGATPTGDSAIDPPAPLLWSALGLMVALGVLILAGLLVLYRWWRHRSGSLPGILTDRHYIGARAGLTPHEQLRARAVASARGLHTLVEQQGVRYLGWLVLIGAAVIAAGTAAAVAGYSPLETEGSGEPPGWLKALVDIGGSLAALLPVLIGGIGFMIYRDGTFRRSVGVIWDIATFWPRSAHPFAPPCYAELAVPQLQTRVAGLLQLPPDHPQRVGQLILAGHSQGAVLCVATLLQLPEPVQQRIWLITFGCQLNRLYGRVFPAYLGPARLGAVSTVLAAGASAPRWTSLWRATDPLGYPVKGGGDLPLTEIELLDPAALRPADADVSDPPIRGHSNYQIGDGYREARQAAVGWAAGDG